ncbi:MAG TPA: pilin [Candidatus Moranbacteria bacterium]|nr:pilin [Candidatus Moranbacteria bacterium]
MKKIEKILIAIYVGTMLFMPKVSLALFGLGDPKSDGLQDDNYGLPTGTIFGIIENILKWLLGVLSVVSLIGFIIAGIMYLTAAGDETRAGNAKKAMMYSIIGVIVGLAGYVVFAAAQNMLNSSSF